MRVEIIDITDRSGSMSDIRADVIGGFNTMIEEQKAVKGDARLTYIQFDDHYQVLYAGKNIQDVEPLTEKTYVPRGSTALLDAIGLTLNEQGKRIAAEGWAEKIIVCIRTDGQENASKEYKLDTIKAMIKHAEDHGWVFIFTGADQDAFSAAQNIGISASMQYTSGYDKSDPHGTSSSYAATSGTIRSLRADQQNIPDNALKAKI
jgi:hypothetical protein